MKNCAYSELYLEDALKNMGELLEYAYEKKKEKEILKYFVISGFAKRWDDGDPRIIAGMSGTELYYAINRACGITEEPDKIKALVRYDAGEPYWCGYILAYYHWKTCKSFAAILQDIDYEKIRRLYPAFHTASDERCVVEIDMICNMNRVSHLQKYRKMLSLTQKYLSDESGVNLRTLQQYEIGDKDINKASADKVINLSKVLKCSPEDIMQ